ncbi:hypothetical protein FBU30_003001 [Linnemannia zychae]|nr:hypothetical protein FBU30_003001 [Linnemannia zychae]
MSWPADLLSWNKSNARIANSIITEDASYIVIDPKATPNAKVTVRARAPITEEFVATALPKIIIVGASIGGLVLAIILEKAGIPYRIFERSKVFELVESAVFFNAQTAKVFRQLGLNDEIVAAGRETNSLKIFNEDRVLTHILDYSCAKQLYGSPGFVLPKPVLYEILLRHIPSSKIVRGVKVLSVSSGDLFVTVTQDNGDTAVCDILVGADGTHSAVRQSILNQMRKSGKADPKDMEPMEYSTVCLIGQTRPLTDAEFPNLTLEESQFVRVLGRNKPFSVTYFTTKQRTIAYSITEYLDNITRKENNPFLTSDWGQAAVDQMCNKVKDIPIITGGCHNVTVSQLFDLSDRAKLRKIVMEEKIFTKWHFNRAVLIGNASHRLSPAAGSGATNAVLDAVTLANWIVSLPSYSLLEDISYGFHAYQEERMPWVYETLKSTRFFKKLLSSSFRAKILRAIIKYGAKPVIRKLVQRMGENQPQLYFLELIEDEGTMKSAYQNSLHEPPARVQARKKKALQSGVNNSMNSSGKTGTKAVAV